MLFPSRGRDVPFTVANHAYVDRHGRETVTWSRRFTFARRHRVLRRTSRRTSDRTRHRTFDATMIHSKQRGTIVDHLGTHQHPAVDIHCSVGDDGGMCIRSGEQRLYEGRLAFRFPLALSGVADVREWWDDGDQRFHIDVRVTNRFFGPLFGYRGSFTVTEHPCAAGEIPPDVLPVREELRE